MLSRFLETGMVSTFFNGTRNFFSCKHLLKTSFLLQSQKNKSLSFFTIAICKIFHNVSGVPFEMHALFEASFLTILSITSLDLVLTKTFHFHNDVLLYCSFSHFQNDLTFFCHSKIKTSSAVSEIGVKNFSVFL